MEIAPDDYRGVDPQNSPRRHNSNDDYIVYVEPRDLDLESDSDEV